MSSWIGWLSRPSKKGAVEASHTPTKLETDSAASTATPAASTNSPSRAQLYPSLDSAVSTPSAPLLSDAIRDDWMSEAAAKTSGSSGSSNGPVNEKQLSEKDLAKIKEENERLKNVLQQIQRKPSSSSSSSSPLASYNFQHVGHIPGGNGFLLSIPSLSTPATPSAPSSGSPSSSTAAASASTASSSSSQIVGEKAEKVKDALVCHGEHSTVLVKQVKDENESENAVALLDLKEVDWWVMVNGTEGTDKATPNGSSSSTSVELEDDECVRREAGLRIVKSHLAYDDEGYVLIDENDFIQALSDFISQSIARQYPEAERIPPQELQKVLRQAFLPIKQPSSFGKAYQWAQFLYQSYSWGSCAWSLYREPFYVKLVLRGAMKAAQWLLVLVI